MFRSIKFNWTRVLTAVLIAANILALFSALIVTPAKAADTNTSPVQNLSVWTGYDLKDQNKCNLGIAWQPPYQINNPGGTYHVIVQGITDPKYNEGGDVTHLSWQEDPIPCGATYSIEVQTKNSSGAIIGSSKVSSFLIPPVGFTASTNSNPTGDCPPLNLKAWNSPYQSGGVISQHISLAWNIFDNKCTIQPVTGVIRIHYSIDSGGKNIVYQTKVLSTDVLSKITTGDNYIVNGLTGASYSGVQNFSVCDSYDSKTKLGQILGCANVSINLDDPRLHTVAGATTGNTGSNEPSPDIPKLTGAPDNATTPTKMNLSWNDTSSACVGAQVTYKMNKDGTDISSNFSKQTTKYTDLFTAANSAQVAHTYQVTVTCNYGAAGIQTATSNKEQYNPPANGKPATVTDQGGGSQPNSNNPTGNETNSGKSADCENACKTNKWGWLNPSAEIRDLICNMQCTVIQMMANIISAMINGMLVTSIL